MQSKNKKPPSAKAQQHIARLKEQPCACCDSMEETEIHEIVQGQWFLSMPLCVTCHRHSLLGLHGQRRMWSVRKLDELGALSKAIERLYE